MTPLPSPLTQLMQRPERHGFFQAVRLLLAAQRGAGATPAPGSAPAMLRQLDAVLRVGASASLSFPPGELHSLELADASAGADGPALPPLLRVHFMGLTGPSGVLPRHYTEWLMQPRQARDGGAAAFFDLFNHRVLLQFWLAWARHQPAITHELAPQQGILQHVHDLIGMGTRGLWPAPGAAAAQAQRSLPPQSVMAYYSGLLAQRPHSSAALAQVVGDLGQAPVRAEPCVGSWQPIAPRHRLRLGAASRLGQGAQLGSRCWDRQSTLRLHVGPLTRPQFQALQPGGGTLEDVAALARFMAGTVLDLRVRLHLRADAVPAMRLQVRHRQQGASHSAAGAEHAPGRLGWSTWLAGRTSARPADDCEFHFDAQGAKG